MHPAFSVIFFTTASGAGYGLLVWWAAAGMLGLLPADRWVGLVGLGTALLAITSGLISSTFHLGHPERAWRAISQVRSSWLSREGLVAIVTYVPALLLAGLWAFGAIVSPIMAVLAMLGAAATVLCTGQIYATLTPIARWHHPLTTPVYLAFAAASGAILAQFLTKLVGSPSVILDLAALVTLPVAWLLKELWWRQTDTGVSATTIETATGLGGRGKVRPLDPPHTASNYLQDEMGYRVARKHALKLRRYARLFGLVGAWVCAALAAALGAGFLAGLLALLAVLAVALGLLIERWLFFAEARHTVSLYYDRHAA